MADQRGRGFGAIQNRDLAFLTSKILAPKEVVEHFQRIRLGYSSSDKLRILEITFLHLLISFVPGKYKLRFNRMIQNLCLRTIISVDGVRYFLLDLESIWILSKDFQGFMRKQSNV